MFIIEWNAYTVKQNFGIALYQNDNSDIVKLTNYTKTHFLRALQASTPLTDSGFTYIFPSQLKHSQKVILAIT